MKALFVATGAVVVLLAVGFVVLPRFPAVGVGLGLVFLISGLLWPTKARCTGLHCANCPDHH